MRREVTINGYNIDVGMSDIPNVIFNNPILQDISGVKLNRTTTYKIPLTDKNRKIIELIDNVNASSGFVRRFHTLNEFRDGIPVIDNGRMRIISTGSGNMEASVTWGAPGTISDEIGKENINDLPGESIYWGISSSFITESSGSQIGFLFFLTLQGTDDVTGISEGIEWHLPSVRTDHIFDKILGRLTTSYSVSTALRAELERLWIPCLTKKARDTSGLIPTNASRAKTIGNCTLTLLNYGGGIVPIITTHNYSILQEISSGTFGSFRDNACYPAYKTLYLNAWTDFKMTCKAVMSIPSAKIGDQVIFKIRAWEIDKKAVWDISRTEILLTESNFNDTTLTYTFTTDKFKIDVDNDQQPMILDTWFLSIAGNETALIDGVNCTITNEYTYFLSEEESDVSFGNYIDPIFNLPKISQLDFLKNIMSITASYARFIDGVIHFDFIDTILESEPLNIEKLILTPKPDKYEYIYSDYAQSNHYKYTEDDSVSLNANGVIAIADETLSKEKDIVELKFGASDSLLNIARIEMFNYDELKYIGSNLKPRIITTRISASSDAPPLSGLLLGTFNRSMLWSNILENRYKLIRSILNEPKVIEVDMLFSVVDLYRFNDTGLYYFWGAYWIQIETTVNGDGTAKGKFIMLN